MSTEKKSLLFITTELPYPANSGGRIKSSRLIQFLSEYFDVRLVCAHSLESKPDLGKIRETFGVSSVQVFDTFKPRTPFNWFMALMQFPSFGTFRVYSKKLESMMKWGIDGADVVIIDHLDMMEMINQKQIGKVYYHSHNTEHKLWEDFALLEANPIKKWIIELEANRVKRFESWVIRKSKKTFAAPNDIENLKDAAGVDSDKFHLTYHLGDESFLDQPDLALEENGHKIFYAGTLNWMPNKDGLIWFLENCWGHIRSHVSDAELNICGSGADSDLLRLIETQTGVNYMGYVEDLKPLMAASSAAIVPLRFGSGMKIKTFDALYRGIPLITTSVGVEGAALESGVHCLIADDPSAFSNSVVEMLNDRTKASGLATAGRTLVRTSYTYPIIFKQMLTNLS
ncbi:glycosyltransferase family 4 protein [Salibacteraceae bacterium]|nr:glycosyltransferase family 4 protein [Salibacteraceae bacterium]